MGLGAIIGGVGAIASVGGSLISSSAQKNAANKAADVSLEVAEKNNALAREIYGKNETALSPYMERGNAAGGAINALLGLASPTTGTTTTTTTGAPAGPATTGALTAPEAGWAPPPGMEQYYKPNGNYIGIGDPAWYGDLTTQLPGETSEEWQMRKVLAGQAPIPNTDWSGWRPTMTAGAVNSNGTTNALTTTTTTPGLTAQQQAEAAFNNYKQSTGYQFRVDQGNKALNAGWAGGGSLKSGAAGKAFEAFGQNIASGEFSNYMGLLANQQGVGLSGASALAGVGQNYVNNVSANNNSAGTAAANAILASGANNGVGNALSTLGGAAFQYGIGKVK